MIIWQVNWNPHDRMHKLFVVAENDFSNGRALGSYTVASFRHAKRRTSDIPSYYFYMELII